MTFGLALGCQAFAAPAVAGPCEIAGLWRVTYAWEGGASRGLVSFTVKGNVFVGIAQANEDGPGGQQTIRGMLVEGAIRAAEVFHGRRGWQRALVRTDDACATVTLALTDAEVTLQR